MSLLAVSFPIMIREYVVFFLVMIIHQSTAMGSTSTCYTSIFALGDSLTDNGNLLFLSSPTIIHQGRLPNGETYFHHPTGRCCDGRLIIDFLAENFGLPMPPPFAGVLKNGSNTDVSRGVNFAVSGARALETWYYDELGIIDPVTGASLGVQMGWFKQLLPSFCGKKSDCKKQLKSSFVLLGPIGGNDYRYALLGGVSLEERKFLAHGITAAISTAVSELIELGVGTVMVPGLIPDGCLAVSLTYFGNPNEESGCIPWLNDFAEFHHNNLLRQRLNLLRERYPDANIIYADYFGAAMQLYTSPEKYGFSRSFAACCGAGLGSYNYDKEVQCGDPLTKVVCPDPSLYINWDGSHFTEAANEWITNALLQGTFTYPDHNIIPPSCSIQSPLISLNLPTN